MDISRSKADTPRLSALSVDLDGLQGPCVGCADCVGLCEALLEALFVPDVVLSRKRAKYERYENSSI